MKHRFKIFFQPDEAGGAQSSAQTPATPSTQTTSKALHSSMRDFGSEFIKDIEKSDSINSELDQKERQQAAPQTSEANPQAKEVVLDPAQPQDAQRKDVDIGALAKELGVEDAAQSDDSDPVLAALIKSGDAGAIDRYAKMKYSQGAAPVQPQASAQPKEEEKAAESSGSSEDDVIAGQAWSLFQHEVHSNLAQYGNPAVLSRMSLKDYAEAAAKGDIEKILPPPPKDSDAEVLREYKLQRQFVAHAISTAKREAMRDARDAYKQERTKKLLEQAQRARVEKQDVGAINKERSDGALDALETIARTQGIPIVDQRTGSLNPVVADFADKVFKHIGDGMSAAKTRAEAKAIFARAAISVLHKEKIAQGAQSNVDNGARKADEGNQTSSGDLPKTMAPGSSGNASGFNGGGKTPTFRNANQFRNHLDKMRKEMGL